MVNFTKRYSLLAGFQGSGRSYWMAFKDVKKLVQKLELKSRKEWRQYWKTLDKSLMVPCAVSQVYKDKGWKGWADFLGKED